MNTPIQSLYIYLRDAQVDIDGVIWNGINADWQSPTGTEPPPNTQMRYLEETEVASNERILLIKNVSSGGGNRFVSNPVFTFAVMGKVGEPAAYAETYANIIYKALLQYTDSDCITGIDPLGNVNGAYKMESGRYAYDMDFTVGVDSGLV